MSGIHRFDNVRLAYCICFSFLVYLVYVKVLSVCHLIVKLYFVSFHMFHLPSGQSASFICSSLHRLCYITIVLFPFGPLLYVDVLGTYCVSHLFMNFHLVSLHYYLSWGQTTPFISTFLHRLYPLTNDRVGPAVRLLFSCDPIVI